MDREKSKQLFDKFSRVYEDWLKTRSLSQKRRLNETLENQAPSIAFNSLMKMMGEDGKRLMETFQREWTLIDDTTGKAKTKLYKQLKKSGRSQLKEAKKNDEEEGIVHTPIGQSYYPVADRSKSMYSIQTPTDRDLLIQIRNAISGGNMEIARELIVSGWGSLSLTDRNSLINWVNSIGTYNVNVEGAEDHRVPKGGTMTLQPLEKRSDMTKTEFANSIVHTALENMKVS